MGVFSLSKRKKSLPPFENPDIGRGYIGQNVNPQDVNGLVTTRTEYYKSEILYPMLSGRFNITCPKTWDKDYIISRLVRNGYVCIADFPKNLGVYPLGCTLYGVNVLYKPTQCLITNPFFTSSINKTIGIDCVLVHLLWYGDYAHYFNFNEILNMYAQRLANVDCSIDVNLINTRLGYIGVAQSNAQALTLKKLFTKISSGEPLVVTDETTVSRNKNPFMLLNANPKNTFIANDSQDLKQQIIDEFKALIGIKSANTQKKERLISSEVEATKSEKKSLIERINDNLYIDCKQVQEMFNVDFKIEMKVDKDNDTI